MKTVILCGGKGTRMKEETEFRPKPLIEIGVKPMIWHIMKIYSYYGYNDFILCVGYKGHMIKQYFMEMCWRNNNFTIHTGSDMDVEYHSTEGDNWNITIVDTGQDTLTGGRIKQIQHFIDEDKFMLTYGDGLSDVNIHELVQYHKEKGRIATLTGVHPISPFGIIESDNELVTAFKEKPVLNDYINGGFMVINSKVFDYIDIEDCSFEQEPLKNLASDFELAIFKHDGFWTAIDTYKDIQRVNDLWKNGLAKWKQWV